MTKFLLLVAVLAAVWFIWKATKIARPSGDDASAKASRDQPANRAPEPMVRCRHCGVYFPQSEAVGAGDELFCSTEHRAIAVRERDAG